MNAEHNSDIAFPESIGMIIEYHKGERCWVDKATYCQEGYCSGCYIYLLRKGVIDESPLPVSL